MHLDRNGRRAFSVAKVGREEGQDSSTEYKFLTGVDLQPLDPSIQVAAGLFVVEPVKRFNSRA